MIILIKSYTEIFFATINHVSVLEFFLIEMYFIQLFVCNFGALRIDFGVKSALFHILLVKLSFHRLNLGIAIHLVFLQFIVVQIRFTDWYSFFWRRVSDLSRLNLGLVIILSLLLPLQFYSMASTYAILSI